MSATLAPPVGSAPMSSRISGKRRAKDRAFTAFLWVCGVLAMLPLLFIASYVVAKGVKALNIEAEIRKARRRCGRSC